jgi:hypothetical protein
LLVTQNRIWGNRAASDDYVWDGGAFSIFGASRVTISENTIWDNENVLETGTERASAVVAPTTLVTRCPRSAHPRRGSPATGGPAPAQPRESVISRGERRDLT